MTPQKGQCSLIIIIAAKPQKLKSKQSGAFAADAAGELDVLGKDGDALAVDSAKVSILIQPHKVSL